MVTRFFLLFFLFEITACKPKASIELAEPPAIHETIDIIAENEPDSYQSVFVNESNNAPKWLIDHYTIFVSDTSNNPPFWPYQITLLEYNQVNDHCASVIFQRNDGVCMNRYLASFYQHKAIDEEEVERECDGDASSPEYTYIDYFSEDGVNFIVLEGTERPAQDSVLDEKGDFKGEHSMHTVELRTDSVWKKLQVLPNGTIKKTKLNAAPKEWGKREEEI